MKLLPGKWISRLRRLLMVRGTRKWNGWVRDLTAKLGCLLVGGCLTGCQELTDRAYDQQVANFDKMVEMLERNGVAYQASINFRGVGELFWKESVGLDTGVTLSLSFAGNAKDSGEGENADGEPGE